MRITNLETFDFSLTESIECIARGVKGRAVTVPHTWNVEDDTEEFVGCGWYSTTFFIAKMAVKTVIKFDAVYRDCEVFVNGVSAAVHNGSGYTPFEVDITNTLQLGDNLLVVKCCNNYSEDALPYLKAFDWANDGGIIRGVELIEYNSNQALNVKVAASITDYKESGLCDADIEFEFDYLADEVEYTAQIIDYRTNSIISDITAKGNRQIINLQNAKLWDVDSPNLYYLELQFGDYVQRTRFGIRCIETRGRKIYLNNREIRLLAVEWMPGSNPQYGMAEPKSELDKNLTMLKDLNCNFTRFHWQQDKAVFDWCDEHGLMVQEEIPYWGNPRVTEPRQLAIAKAQADEMLKYHINHPSIVCWGVGNELDGWAAETIEYVKAMKAYFKSQDSSRLVNYVSNSFASGKFKTKRHYRIEASVYGDICMWNDYLGTWQPAVTYDKYFRYALQNTKGKPLVSTEFGLCEPRFKGGDPRRIKIYKQKIAKYKKFGLAGWVYFCLNDYRTHVGEDGKGKLRQRIHGSVTLDGEQKPSYNYIKAQNKNDKI